MNNKFKILFFFILGYIVLITVCIAQERPLYIPKNWESFKELSDHLSDTTGYIGRLYQYSNKELYFKDSDGLIKQVTNESSYTPETYGAVGDGITDDTQAFLDLISAIGTNEVTVQLTQNYYLNTSGGITFTAKVNLIGPGIFTIGSGVGNNPAITISGERSYLSDFEIIGDHTNFTNANLSTELRRNIKIIADYVTCENLKDTNSIVGIELNSANFCTIKDCISINDIIIHGIAFNNYNCGIYLTGSSDNRIIGNYISGHGNGVLHGGASYRNIINNNTFYGADNNSIYISSGQFAEICGNIIKESDDSGIKARDSYHLIANNLIDQNSWAEGTGGILVSGNGTPDADGFNGEQTLVIGNVIRGDYVAAINFRVQDNGYLRNPLVVGNTIELTGDPNRGQYGVQVKGRSQGAIITDNTIHAANYGIFMNTDDPNVDVHRNCLISNNHIHNSITTSVLLDYFSESSIQSNMIYDSPQFVIKITNSTNVNISNNYIEDWYHAVSANVGISIGGNNHTIKNNYLERTAWGGVAYGIRMENQSEKISIIGNTFKANDYGIFFLMADANTDYHRHAIVENNYFIDSNYGGVYGVQLHSCLINNNGFYDVGEEPILFTDSNNVTISYNIIKDTGIAGHDLLDEAITVKGNSYEVIGNLIEVEDSSAIFGIVAYGDGSADSDNYNGYDTTIKNNHIIGPFTTGISTLADGGYYLKNPKIINNTIEIESGGAYGIRLDGRSNGASIVGNNISGSYSIGIYTSIDDPNTDTHERMLIKGNDACGSTSDGLFLTRTHYSLITDNVFMNGTSNGVGITLSTCTYNNVINNLLGDNQDTATQKYGVLEQTASDYNIIIDNDCERLTNSGIYRYTITGSNSLVETNRMVVETDDGSGTRTFEIGEFKTIVIDPNGGNINLNPRVVTWPMINELIVVNTANAAETITFDSAGLNQAINQNERAVFVFDGSNWLKVYVGS